MYLNKILQTLFVAYMEIRDLTPKSKISVIQAKNELAPQWPFRCIIIGASGSGKTNVLMNLIQLYLNFNTLTVFARHLDNDQYQDLMDIVEQTEKDRKETFAFFSDDLSELPAVNDFSRENANLVVFDDWAALEQHEHKPINDYFIRGRHKNMSVLYLSQSYKALPAKARKQANFFCLFNGMTEDDRKDFHSDWIHNMPFKEFDKIYKEITQKPHGFMVVDEQRPNLHIREGFDKIYVPE